MLCKTRLYLTTTDQQVHITDEREWVVVLSLQLVFDSIQQFGTRDQHSILVEVVLVQTVHRDIGKQWSGLAFHDIAIQTDVR